MRYTLLLASTLFCAAAMLTGPVRSAHAEAPFSFSTTPGQLPKTVVPSAYDIDLVTDMKALTLRGHEMISVSVSAVTDTVTLNQAGLTVRSATIDGAPATVSTDEKGQTLTLRSQQPLAAGSHKIDISYAGPIPQTPNGIYYDDYRDSAGAKKRMLVTQFEVADARRMFPCWDEPAFKATFRLNVTLPKAWVPISNMPVESTAPASDDTQRVTFATTPRMSTYLLALVAGDLAATHGQGGATPISTWAPKGEEQSTEYATHAASEILPYYNGYFGTAYPLPKLDLIAVPGNYEAGAMENWGAITFIDEDLLYDPAHSSPGTKELVYLVVAHEMAHQWSGDLVTMAWWDNIWLNEGFATWMETKALDHFNPTWEVWPREHMGRERAMAQDALSTTHPIQQPVRDVSQAGSAFDGISYQKGEQVIRMIETWLGPDTFRDGMRDYMKTHAYSNATSADLWNALSASSHQDVGAVARTFTEQPGIPLISVSENCRNGNTVIGLKQSRFTIHDPNAAALHWRVPVVIGGPGVPAQKVVLTDKATLRFHGCGKAIKANPGEGSYYRTAYDAASFRALKENFTRFDATDRVNLLGDQFALFQADKGQLADYLDLVSGLSANGETSIAVWQDTLTHLSRLDDLERGSPSRPAFRAFVRTVLTPQLSRLGWDPKPGESFLDTLLRPQIIQTLGVMDDADVAAEAAKRFTAWRKNPASLDPGLVQPVMQTVGLHANAETWNVLADMVRKAPDTEQKRRFYAALARSQNPELIRKAVRLAWSGAIPNGRIVRSLAVLAQNSENPDLVWEQVVASEADISGHLTPQSREDLLPAIAAATFSPEIVAQMKAAPVSSATSGGKIAADRSAEEVAMNIGIRLRAQPAIAQWLAASGAGNAAH
ncbi:M1 family peptidase [Acetobacter sp. LMG 1636]|uniref:Aminopeptidase n=2 Tax=Acetobacter fallax TaxID=1737473 RepID=A0ABX0K9L5_9PROT|nr:M1 family peptidase [Acetobacter fallax]NHO36058.1 M1 family peptidase [Acetobacter fallax]